MKKLFFISFLSLLLSCKNQNHTATRVIDGNSFALSNGITVTLENVGVNAQNIRILERYLIGNILLYDEENLEINKISSDHITAWVYNSDGDCVNNLFTGISEITKDKVTTIKDNLPTIKEIYKTVVKFEE